MISVKHLTRPVSIAVMALLAGLVLQSCFTGIEHTGHIDLSKKDKEISRKISTEEAFMADIKGLSADRWDVGREFRVVGERSALLFDNPPGNPYGVKLKYAGQTEMQTPAGTQRVILIFTDSVGRTFKYQSTKQAPGDISSTELPMLIDIDLVRQLNDKLTGRQLWTKTSDWLTPAGEPATGRKFEAVTITGVVGGSENLPYSVLFKDETGQLYFVRMSQTEGTLATRPFHTLFSLSDPRKEYSGISDEIWQKIRRGNISTGMTKQECRLALGAPAQAESGRDFSKTIDIWTYANGIYLRFEDGILVDFRK